MCVSSGFSVMIPHRKKSGVTSLEKATPNCVRAEGGQETRDRLRRQFKRHVSRRGSANRQDRRLERPGYGGLKRVTTLVEMTFRSSSWSRTRHPWHFRIGIGET